MPLPIRIPRTAIVALSATVLAGSLPATAAAGTAAQPVTNWARHHAAPVESVVQTSRLDDLTPLGPAVGDAAVVGLGESAHGASELLTLRHRALRFLVEELGFRTVVWEEDWTIGLLVDDYIRSGRGDPEALVRQMSFPWRSGEVVDVLRWLRTFNAGRTDQVRFVGVEHYATGRLAYDALRTHVGAVAPDRLPELERHVEVVYPSTADQFAYAGIYAEIGDKEPYLHAAHAVRDLVVDLPHEAGDLAHEVAVHHADQIVAFHEHYAMPFPDSLVYRESRAAANVRWWHDLDGGRIAYWAASAHTANAPDLRISRPAEGDLRFPSAGSFLRGWYGDGYRSIGFTFDRGAVHLGAGDVAAMPPADASWFEAPLAGVGHDQFILDLRAPAPPPVRRWLEEPVVTRGLDADAGSFMDGGTLEQWFDVLVHRQVVTPAAGP